MPKGFHKRFKTDIFLCFSKPAVNLPPVTRDSWKKVRSGSPFIDARELGVFVARGKMLVFIARHKTQSLFQKK